MPLTFDFPLDQLRSYHGTNARPVDFDQYWERALMDMRATEPRTRLVPARFQVPGVDCSDLWFSGVGGANVHAQLLRPSNGHGPHPALLMFHGYSSNANDWSFKLGFVAQGFIVAALDTRGQGGLSEDSGGVTGNTLNGHIIRGLTDAVTGHPEKLLFRQNFLDTAQLARIVFDMPEVDPSRVFATGASQGGGLTVACAALEPRIRKAAPIYPFLSDYQRVWQIDLAANAYAELQEYFRRFDPRHEQEAEIFNALGYVDIHHLAPRVKAEVLWGCGLMDRICPPSTQFAAYNNLKTSKRMVVYPDFGHEDLPGMADEILQFLLKD